MKNLCCLLVVGLLSGCSLTGLVTKDSPEFKGVAYLNKVVNREVLFEEDIDIYGVEDYWAHPQETLGSSVGDCDDVAILKYWALARLGVPHERLGLAVGHVTIKGVRAGHMLLSYKDADGKIFALDSATDAIAELSDRADFEGSVLLQKSGNLRIRDNEVTARVVRIDGAPEGYQRALSYIFSVEAPVVAPVSGGVILAKE